MIISCDPSQNDVNSAAICNSSTKVVPDITQEEDRPFVENEEWKTIETKEHEFNRSLSIFKHLTAKNILLTCMVGIIITVILDICLKDSSELVKEAFEFFKLMALTTTGYLFGSSKPS